MLRRLPRRVLRLRAWRSLSQDPRCSQRRDRLDGIGILQRECHQRGEVRRRPFARDVALGKADVPAGHQAPKQPPAMDRQLACGPGLAALDDKRSPAGVSITSRPHSSRAKDPPQQHGTSEWEGGGLLRAIDRVAACC